MANEDGAVSGSSSTARSTTTACSGPSSKRTATGFARPPDTEVIVHGYEESGAACVERLRGHVRLRRPRHPARRDVRRARPARQEAAVLRPRLATSFHLASELKALKRSPLWTGDLDEDVLDAYLALGYVPAPRTAYRGRPQAAARPLAAHAPSGLQVQRYWTSLPSTPTPSARRRCWSRSTACSRRRSAAASRARSLLGAFLSGGIDSGTRGLVHGERRPTRPPVTLTVGFSEDPANELAAASATADRPRHPHHAPPGQASTLEPMLDVIARAFDEPFADSSAVPTYPVCGAAREHVTVALSGDGGDETFAGYDFRYVPHMREEWLRQRLGARRWRCRRRPGDAVAAIAAAAASATAVQHLRQPVRQPGRRVLP